MMDHQSNKKKKKKKKTKQKSSDPKMGIDWRIHFFDSTGFKYLNELTNCFCQHSQHSPTQ